jgi:ATP-binding cassette subfamily B protein
MAAPHLPLLRGSVERNLRYRHPDATDEELARVVELCGLGDVLAELPDGLRSRVRDGGVNLSAGQRQRLALARALLGEPRVLLLDEPDANLDVSAREAVDRVIRNRRGHSTILVVSHRAEALALADVSWRLENGRIVRVDERNVATA